MRKIKFLRSKGLPLREEAGSIMRPECHDVRPTPTSASLPSVLPLSLLSPISTTSVTSSQPPANYKPTPVFHHINPCINLDPKFGQLLDCPPGIYDEIMCDGLRTDWPLIKPESTPLSVMTKFGGVNELVRTDKVPRSLFYCFMLHEAP